MITTLDERPTLLIVDDEEEIRATVRLLLRTTELQVVGEAGGGIEAVSLALRTQPDLILLDQKMPDMTGEETTEILRQASPGSLIIAFSAYLDRHPDWADGYLPKDRVAEVAEYLTTFLGSIEAAKL